MLDIVNRNIDHGVYDKNIIQMYTVEEFEKCNSYIKHSRDLSFTYAGLQQIVDKYLVQDRSSGDVFETPQFMYMLIAMTLFQNYDKEVRLDYVKKGITTSSYQLSKLTYQHQSWQELELHSDNLHHAFSLTQMTHYPVSSPVTMQSESMSNDGIGINNGRIRGIGSKIRGGEVQHTGVIPFLKKFESTVRCCTQNGVRGGSATVHFPIWHQEIEDILVLKNNKGTEDNRVRKTDYSIQLSQIFYQRFLENGEITLFSPHDVPILYEAFGTEEFDELYEKYERATSYPKQKSVQEN